MAPNSEDNQSNRNKGGKQKGNQAPRTGGFGFSQFQSAMENFKSKEKLEMYETDGEYSKKTEKEEYDEEKENGNV